MTGQTRLVGVLGWPVSHSRSPAMHNAAFAALGLDWAYLPLPVRPERIAEAVIGLRALGFAGANVTVPHKQAVRPLMDELTPSARAVGAVNTILIGADGRLTGDTTDGYGFLQDLADHGVVGPRATLVLGSGGAARSVVYALAEAGCSVTVCARDVRKAAALCEDLAVVLPGAAPRLSAAALPADLRRLAATATLVVNATSLGLHDDEPAPWDEAIPFRPDQVAYDLIYNRPTEFLKLAVNGGARAIAGLGMLVHQGARAFEMWTGVAAPVGVMRRAVQV